MSNLLGAEADDVSQLGDDQIDTLERGFLEAGYLLLDDGLKGKIGSEETDANTVDVANGKRDFAAQLLLVKLHFDNFKRETLVEQAVDLGTTRQFHRVNIGRARTFDGPFEIRLELLDHPEVSHEPESREMRQQQQQTGVEQIENKHGINSAGLLKHGFRLDARIVGTKVFELLHFLLHAQQLFLHGKMKKTEKKQTKSMALEFSSLSTSC